MDATQEKAMMTGKSYLVRLYEANCALAFPTENDLRFRDSVANSLTHELNLKVASKSSPPAPANPPPSRKS